MAYSLLGYLAWTVDGRELPELFRERIFKPLGMSQSEPAIDFHMRDRLAKNYHRSGVIAPTLDTPSCAKHRDHHHELQRAASLRPLAIWAPTSR